MFAGELIALLASIAEGYAGGRPELLYYPVKPSDLQVLTKPYASVLTKVYRLNCLMIQAVTQVLLNTASFAHDSIFSHDKMNDLLRARLVCKYMDGPEVCRLRA